MKLYMDFLLLLIISYFTFDFLRLLWKMRKDVLFPKTKVDMEAIRLHPEVKIQSPTFSNQKVGIMAHLGMLLFMMILFLLGIFMEEINWTFYPLMVLLLFYSRQFYRLFAIVDGGILCGSRFVSWEGMKSFEYIPIDKNHKFYGYSREVNGEYELKIKTRWTSVCCVVTKDETREKLGRLLREHMKV